MPYPWPAVSAVQMKDCAPSERCPGAVPKRPVPISPLVPFSSSKNSSTSYSVSEGRSFALIRAVKSVR